MSSHDVGTRSSRWPRRTPQFGPRGERRLPRSREQLEFDQIDVGDQFPGRVGLGQAGDDVDDTAGADPHRGQAGHPEHGADGVGETVVGGFRAVRRAGEDAVTGHFDRAEDDGTGGRPEHVDPPRHGRVRAHEWDRRDGLREQAGDLCADRTPVVTMAIEAGVGAAWANRGSPRNGP